MVILGMHSKFDTLHFRCKIYYVVFIQLQSLSGRELHSVHLNEISTYDVNLRFL